MKTKLKRAIYIGPQDSRKHTLSYGMTGYYDMDNAMFIPDSAEGNCGYHAVPEEDFKFTEY